jgi:hypothetical protein
MRDTFLDFEPSRAVFAYQLSGTIFSLREQLGAVTLAMEENYHVIGTHTLQKSLGSLHTHVLRIPVGGSQKNIK